MTITTYTAAWNTQLDRPWNVLYDINFEALVRKFHGITMEAPVTVIWNTLEIPESYDALQTYAIIKYLAVTHPTSIKRK